MCLFSRLWFILHRFVGILMQHSFFLQHVFNFSIFLQTTSSIEMITDISRYQRESEGSYHLRYKRVDKLNSPPPIAAYMRHWIGSALFQIMACPLFGAKPLSKPVLFYCRLFPQEQTSMKFELKYKNFFIHENAFEKRHQRNGEYFVQRGDELTL